MKFLEVEVEVEVGRRVAVKGRRWKGMAYKI